MSLLLQEPNFHGLYLALLDKLGDKKLSESLVATTHKYIRILLASTRIKTHTSERSLLKNLGTWCVFSPSCLCFLYLKKQRPHPAGVHSHQDAHEGVLATQGPGHLVRNPQLSLMQEDAIPA